MKTVTYLKAGLVSRAAIEAKPEVSLNQTERIKEDKRMDLFTKAFLKVRERFVRFHRAQTMTEYALILAAIAVVVYGTYRALGNNIGSLAGGGASAPTHAESDQGFVISPPPPPVVFPPLPRGPASHGENTGHLAQCSF